MNVHTSKVTEASQALTDSHAMLTDSVLALSHRTTQLQHLLNASLARHSNCVGASLPFFMSLAQGDTQTLNELLALQSAIADRFLEQNENWIKGVTQIASEASQMKKANTLSKFMDQQCDLVGQWVSLLTTQTSNLATQFENIQVDVSYWVAQKADT